MLLSDFIQARREKRIEAAKVEGIAEGIAEGKVEGIAEGIAKRRVAKGIVEGRAEGEARAYRSVQSGIVAERKQRHEARSSQNRPQHSRRNNHRRNQKNSIMILESSVKLATFIFNKLSNDPTIPPRRRVFSRQAAH